MGASSCSCKRGNAQESRGLVPSSRATAASRAPAGTALLDVQAKFSLTCLGKPPFGGRGNEGSEPVKNAYETAGVGPVKKLRMFEDFPDDTDGQALGGTSRMSRMSSDTVNYVLTDAGADAWHRPVISSNLKSSLSRPSVGSLGRHVSICSAPDIVGSSQDLQDIFEKSPPSPQQDSPLRTSTTHSLATTLTDNGLSSSDEGSDMETEQEPERMRHRSRQGGVCAGTLDMLNFTPPKYHKETSTQQQLRSALKACALFKALRSDELTAIVDAISIQTRKKGEAIFRQGDMGDALYIVVSGVADCYLEAGKAITKFTLVHNQRSRASKEGATFIQSREAGMIFGELSIMWNQPRSLSVYARDQCVLGRLERQAYQNLVVRKQMLRRERIEACLRKPKLLETLNDEQIAKLADAMEVKVYKSGKDIIRQGDEGKEFFIVQSGECVVTMRTGTDVQEHARFKEGELFGELALVTGKPRAASVTAVTRVEVLKLSRKSFERMLGSLSMLQHTSYKTDPRKLIADFYRQGDERGPRGTLEQMDVAADPLSSPSSWFAVFRPTSRDAIAKMLSGVAVGKGLNVKGKSAKKNRLSGFVPFVQISDNAHKAEIERPPKGSRIRIFFKTKAARDIVMDRMWNTMGITATASGSKTEPLQGPLGKAISGPVSKRTDSTCLTLSQNTTATKWSSMTDPFTPTLTLEPRVIDKQESPGSGGGATVTPATSREGSGSPSPHPGGTPLGRPLRTLSKLALKARKHRSLSTDLVAMHSSEEGIEEVTIITEYEPAVYGLCIPGPLVHEMYVMSQDLTPMVDWETGRQSEPAYMDMNMHGVTGDSRPQIVLYQHDEGNPMNPRGLLIAYAEMSVKPVVSDFDAFLVASRGIKYEPLPPEQCKLVNWMLKNVSEVLVNPGLDDWNTRWLRVMKRENANGFHPVAPELGFGDPTSTRLIGDTIAQTVACGAVRHMPECFNFSFPQALDDEYLIVWEHFPDKPWSYVQGEQELRHFLIDRIAEGFSFPVNPAWCVRDPGWYEVLQALRASPSGKENLDCWMPPESKIQQKIDEIHEANPHGFVMLGREDSFEPLLPIDLEGVKTNSLQSGTKSESVGRRTEGIEMSMEPTELRRLGTQSVKDPHTGIHGRQKGSGGYWRLMPTKTLKSLRTRAFMST